MTNTASSRRISSAMASRSASRTVMVTISVPSGTSGSGRTCGCGGAAAADFGSAGAGAFAGLAAGCAVSAAFGCCAGLGVSLTAEASSPSFRITAIGVLTATSAVPSGIRIFPSVPSSTASTSMVALSVSISAMTSPALTWSPSRLSHLARLPFSMVGDSAGISTWVGIERKSSTRRVGGDVGVQFGRVGLGVVGGELGRLVDDFADPRVDLLQLILARPFFLDKPPAHPLDRIVLAADPLDLLAGAILGRVRHGMTSIAVGQHLQDDRPIAVAASLHRLITGSLYGAHVHAVHSLSRNVVGRPAL